MEKIGLLFGAFALLFLLSTTTTWSKKPALKLLKKIIYESQSDWIQIQEVRGTYVNIQETVWILNLEGLKKHESSIHNTPYGDMLQHMKRLSFPEIPMRYSSLKKCKCKNSKYLIYYPRSDESIFLYVCGCDSKELDRISLFFDLLED